MLLEKSEIHNTQIGIGDTKIISESRNQVDSTTNVLLKSEQVCRIQEEWIPVGHRDWLL